MQELKRWARSTTRLAALMLIAGLAVAATAGIAGGALKTKQAEVSVAPSETESATATCKKGTRAVSGGFNAPGFDSNGANDTYVQTFGSLRSAKRAWTSTANNFYLEEDAGTLVDYAYCSDDLPRLKARSKSATIPDGEVQSLTARCPRGGEAVSGGFDAEISGDIFDGAFPVESRRAGRRSWIVTAQAFGFPAELTAYAYCAKHKLGLKSKVETQTTSEASTNLSGEVRCGKHQKVISGGFSGSFDVEAGGTLVEPFESQRAGRRVWRASTAAYASGEPVRWDVYAYCLEKEKN
jgi:hypothetical protein